MQDEFQPFRVRDAKGNFFSISVITSGLICFTLALVATFHRELITARHWHMLERNTAFMFAGLLVLADGFLARALILNWNKACTLREKIAAVVMGMSTICGMIGFIGMCLPTDTLGFWPSRFWFLAIVFFFIGVGCLPKPAKKTSANPL